MLSCYGLSLKVTDENIKAIDKVLDLVEKQQKEIEELKEYKHDAELIKVSCCTAQNCEALNNCIKLERELQNAEKKIKEKIKELEHKDFISMQVVMKHDKEALKIVEVLKELLEENNND